MGLSLLSMTDIAYTLNIKLLEKQEYAYIKDVVLKPPVEV